MKRLAMVLVLMALVGMSQAAAQTCQLPEGVRVATGTAGSMKQRLGGVEINKESTLLREALVIHDHRLPVVFNGTPVARTTYRDRSVELTVTADVIANAEVRAWSAVVITFDVFGESQGRFGATEVEDIGKGGLKEHTWRWRFSESDALTHFATVAYIRRVRTAEGQVQLADHGMVRCVGELFALSITEADLGDGNP